MAEGKLTVARLPPLQGPRGDARSRVESFGGKPYRLHGKVYPLPPPKALHPYVDTKAGEVDTWPAHASGLALSSSAAMLSKNKSLVIVNDDELGKAPIIPKPRFLEQLETFLRKELTTLGVADVSPSDLRLQAHREVFEYLIEDFKTYKPLLAAIKNEYEMMLAYQRQQIRQLEPLKQMLVTVSEQCDQKIMGLRDEEKQEVANMKAEHRRLHVKISSMANERRDLQEQVTRLQDSLREEHQKYRDECDARKLLVSDINDLRYQQEDYLASKHSSSQEEVTEDPIMLKIALKKAREDESAASTRLAEMVANYGDVIPRRDFEALEKKHKELEEQSELTQTDFRKLQAEHNALLEVNNQVTSQRDEFYLELETLKRSSTPRPEWEKCGEHVQGGGERWQQLSEGKGSNQLVDVLIQEMAAGNNVESNGADYFDGKGTDPSVPKYLRFEGPVRNRHLSKRDALLIIRDIWREKATANAEVADGGKEKMSDFLHSYLQSRFTPQQMVLEWGYNLHDACQRYAQDPVIVFFGKVLDDEADEEIHHEQLQMMHAVLSALTKVDTENGNLGKLDRELFQSTLASALPGLDDMTMMSVMKAAETELDETDMQEVDYKNLFTEDDEGKTGPFLNEIKNWMQQQREKYVNEIKTQLTDTSSVSVDELKQALTAADPDLDPDKTTSYLVWAYGVASEAELADAAPLEKDKLLDRLLNGNISRSTKKA